MRHPQKNKVRIIGGKFKGTLLSFANIEGLRPSGSRCREVLFNWLMADINQSQVLDAFAGSGALGFEALSRGAQQVVFIDTSSLVQQQITTQCKKLNILSQTHIIQANTFDWLNTTKQCFDLIFLDPPFIQTDILPLFKLIIEHQLLNKNGFIYFEQDKKNALPELPSALIIYKKKELGQVRMFLIKYND